MNFLITAIGSFSAECVICNLKKDGNKVYGCDIYPAEWHYESKLCDKVFRAPYATDEIEYIQFLLGICKEYQISHLVPLTDLEIDVIDRHREDFHDLSVVLCMQDYSVLYYARDKFRLSSLFRDDPNVDVPFFANSEDATLDFPIPAIAKPVNGRSSEGLARIYTTGELSNYIGKENYILQEMIDGSIYTVDYVRASSGNDFSVPREELLRTKNGAGTTVRIDPNETLQRTVSYIGNKLGIIGCVNMEFIENNGKYYLIDLNPRFSAGVAFSNFVGYNMIEAHINAIVGKEIRASISFEEQIVCKKYSEVLLK